MTLTTTDLPEKPADTAKKRSKQPRQAPDPARETAISKRVANMPLSMQKSYLRAARGEASPRAAIRAHCLECCGYQRIEVTLCTALACPLFLYRPFQDKSVDVLRP